MTVEKKAFPSLYVRRVELEKKGSPSETIYFARLTGTVFLMSELFKIGLLDSSQEISTSTPKTGPGGLLSLILEEDI
jgi:hypothetical protein